MLVGALLCAAGPLDPRLHRQPRARGARLLRAVRHRRRNRLRHMHIHRREVVSGGARRPGRIRHRGIRLRRRAVHRALRRWSSHPEIGRRSSQASESCVLVVVAVCGVLLRDPPAGLVATGDRPQTVGHRQAGEPQPAQQRHRRCGSTRLARPSGRLRSWSCTSSWCSPPRPRCWPSCTSRSSRCPMAFRSPSERRRLVCSPSSTARAAASPAGSPTASGAARR